MDIQSDEPDFPENQAFVSDTITKKYDLNQMTQAGYIEREYD